MIVLGGIVGGPGVTSFGWVVLLTVVGVRLAIGLLASWLTGRAGLILAGVAIAGVVVAALVVYGLLSWSGWPRALALLGIGVGAGLLLGVLLAGGRRRGDGAASRSANRPPGRPVATAALGLVVVLGLAGASVGHGRNELGDRICRMDDSWYRTFTAASPSSAARPTRPLPDGPRQRPPVVSADALERAAEGASRRSSREAGEGRDDSDQERSVGVRLGTGVRAAHAPARRRRRRGRLGDGQAARRPAGCGAGQRRHP